MHNLKEFSVSSNGDRWFLGTDETSEQRFVLHRGNPSSGGHETKTPIEEFLNRRPVGPEHEALRAILGVDDPQPDRAKTGDPAEADKTPSLKLAEEYLRLGGRRRAKVDDNIVSTRLWEDDPTEAAAFWKEEVEPLDAKQRQEVEVHLPSISDS
jgi:hypothetical protein